MKPDSRIVFVDYIRVAACMMVLIVHACEMYYCTTAPDGSPGWYTRVASESERLWVALYDGFGRMSVPLFMIVSAFLLVPMREGQDMIVFYRKRAARILPAFVFFMAAYCVVPYLLGETDFATACNDLAHLPFNFPSWAGHLWFIYPLAGLYLFIPVISPWLAKASARDERIFVALFAVSTCIPLLTRAVGDVWGECLWNQFGMLWYFSGFIGYLVLAHYIRVHIDWSAAKRQAVGAVCLITGAIPTILGFYLMVPPETYVYTGDAEITWGFCTPNVLLMTFGAFMLFSSIRRREAPRAVIDISGLTYGIYLMHLLVLPFWARYLKAFAMTPAVTIPMIAAATFLTCWAIASLVRLIPLGHHIVGCPPVAAGRTGLAISGTD